MMQECPHGMGNPKSCFECMEEGNLEPSRRESATTICIFTAKYDGDCRECNLTFSAGSLIAQMSDGSYRHERCAS